MEAACHLLLLLLVSTVVGSTLVSCESETKKLGIEDRLVIEGWITTDGFPMVLLHSSYNLNNPDHQSASSGASIEEIVEQQIIYWAKVTITDGDTTIVMTGRLDDDYMPPSTYTTIDMFGTAGKTYTITVDYQDYHATATSTMLPAVPVDSVIIRTDGTNLDSYVYAYFSHLEYPTYIVLLYKRLQESQYKMGGLGCYENPHDSVLAIRLQYKKIAIDEQKEQEYEEEWGFVDSTNYVMRVARVSGEEYTYFQALCSQESTQGTYFMNIYGHLPTLIDNCLGYWSAMGTNDYLLNFTRDTVYRF